MRECTPVFCRCFFLGCADLENQFEIKNQSLADEKLSELEICRVNQLSSIVTDNPVLEVAFTNGSVFFMRPGYLAIVPAEKIRVGETFEGEGVTDLINAGFAYMAERKAADCLARSEQCRTSLEQKLYQKGFEKSAVRLALDYLEKRHFLDDSRYASRWLRNHSIGKFHGRSRLLRELLGRGISKRTADSAINDFFMENDELELCGKAYNKGVSMKKSNEKLLKYLLDCGFSYKMAQNTIKNNSEIKNY